MNAGEQTQLHKQLHTAALATAYSYEHNVLADPQSRLLLLRLHLSGQLSQQVCARGQSLGIPRRHQHDHAHNSEAPPRVHCSCALDGAIAVRWCGREQLLHRRGREAGGAQYQESDCPRRGLTGHLQLLEKDAIALELCE